MNIRTVFEKYVRSGQKVSSQLSRWKPGLTLALAFFFPGVPHILSKKRFGPGCLLGLFGVGALATLTNGILSVLLSDGAVYAFDILSIMFLGNFARSYPLQIAPSIASSQNLLAIWPEGDPFAVQPFYWELLSACIIVYIICAVISCWYQWKVGQVRS